MSDEFNASPDPPELDPPSKDEPVDYKKELIALLLATLLDFRRRYLVYFWPGVAPDLLSDAALMTKAQLAGSKMADEIQAVLQRRAAAAVEKLINDLPDGVAPDYDELKKAVEDAIDRVTVSDQLATTWADSLATDLLGAAAKDAGTKNKSSSMAWITRRDKLVRDTHREMDGQTQPVGGTYRSPSGATTSYPGGFGIWEEDAGCRCQLMPAEGDPDSAWRYFDGVRNDAIPQIKGAILGLMDSHMDDLLSLNTLPAQSMRFELSAMALAMPDDDHPNRMPFTGVLTKLDEPSDNPPGGSSGKRVILPTEVAKKALDSLAAMGVDCTVNFDGHDVKSKVGVITGASIESSDLTISGFIYASDFPKEAEFIQKNKDKLGFSYEVQAVLENPKADPLVISDCIFTGAAVLFKNLAAYTTTSISASADKDDLMNEELKALFAAMNEKLDGVMAEVTEIKAGAISLKAGSVNHLVKPHAEALRACAAGMETSGIGGDAKRGHVAVLRSMADNMEAESHVGKLPHVFHTNDFYYASADLVATKPALDPVTDPKIAELTTQINELKASAEKVALEAAAANKTALEKSPAPERKTVSPAVMALLKSGGVDLKASAEDEMLSADQVNAVLDKAGVTGFANRAAAKLQLQASGMMA